MTTKMIVAAMSLFLCALVPSAYSETTPAPAPKAVLPESIHVFEPVAEGVIVSHDFILENQGGAPLVIESIQTG